MDEWFHERYLKEFRDQADLATGAMDPFDHARYLAGAPQVRSNALYGRSGSHAP